MKIDIIGAGIGGLTTAIALNQKGIRTTIYEQTEKLKPVGAGIILANNAMQVYEKLGLSKTIEDNGNYISDMNITTSNLNILSQVNLSYYEKKYKTRNIAIHRAILQKILINALKPSTIKLGHRLQKIKSNQGKYQLYFKDKELVQSSLLIAADGINSIVRQNLFPQNTIRKTKQICWRGITNFTLPSKHQHELNEAWGKGDRFGFVQLENDKVYWYALKSFDTNENKLSITDIEKHFENYSLLIKNIIRSTQKERIYTATISDLKPSYSWYKNNVCLIGDAAHGMTPNMGQGACQAIEDAYVLSICLKKYDANKAFQIYQSTRLPKAHKIVNTSWTIGKVAHLQNPIAIRLRNRLMQIVPSSLNRKRFDQIFKIQSI